MTDRPTIGASELALCVGLGHPRASALDLWARLRGLLPRYDTETSPDAEAGHLCEPGILLRYARERGVVVLPGPQLPEPGYLHPVETWLSVRPDGLAPDRTLEAKAPRYGWPDLPAHVRVQVLAQVAVAYALTGRAAGDVAVYGRHDGDWRIWTQERDAAVEAGILARGRDWYHRHVEDGIPPAPDGTEAASRALARIWRPEDTTTEATPDDVETWHSLLSVRSAIADLEARERELAQKLQARMGASTVLTEGGRTLATWRGTRGRRTLDADRLRRERPEIAESYTTAGEPGRRFALEGT